MQGTYRFPVVCDGRVVFASEDDLWSCDLAGGIAHRLTRLRGTAAHLAAHPTKPWVAFTGTEEGVQDVYLLDLATGSVRRLTWQGGARVAGWTPDGHVAFASNHDRPFVRDRHLWTVDPEGGTVASLGLGPGLTVAWQGDRVLVGRYREELASWRDYRGGRRGQVWVVHEGRAVPMRDGGGGLATPAWLDGEVVAASDAAGSPQLCRLFADRPPEPLTAHELPVRFVQPCPDGVVYAAGPDLFRYTHGDVQPISVTWRSDRPARARRFVPPSRYLDGVDPHPDGVRVALVTRGKAFSGGWFEGPMRQRGQRHGVRYRLPRWVDGGLLLCSDATGAERLELHADDGTVRTLPPLDGGRPLTVVAAPAGDAVAVVDHRGWLWWVPVEGAPRCLHQGSLAARSPSFSADGRWLAFARETLRRGGPTQIVLARLGAPDDPADPADPPLVEVTSGHYRDQSPSFDPEGRYLYFVSYRELDPTYDTIRFELSFPRGSRPYLVTLQADAPDPFRPTPMPLKRPKAPKPVKTVSIDVDGIADRVVAFPVGESRYVGIAGTAGGRVWMLRRGVSGSSRRRMLRRNPPPADHQLVQWDFEKAELKVVNSRISGFRTDRSRRHLAVRAGMRLRLAPGAPDKAQLDELGKNDARPGRPRGTFDWARVRLELDPPAEWRQMVDETARLMADHHWAGARLDDALVQCRELLPRVGSPSELTDVLHQLHGHVRTSHAYALGGDHRRPPLWRPGRLAADLSWDEAAEAWRIDRILRGETERPSVRSPLIGPGLGVPEGALVTAVDGEPVRRDRPLEAMLAHRGGVEVHLDLIVAGEPREVVVRPLGDDRPVRYRDWVLRQRAATHARSEGRLGYLHVPNMGPTGFAAFHRDYAAECSREALVVDVRWNTGGHVGQLLLSTLARPALGWVQPRWSAPYPYPSLAFRGPMAALANEHSGSDGDMFTHLWQRLGLGPVVGVPTWGGTVGIIARHYLTDGSLVTQPEFAQWFDDIGYGLENRGAQPDVVVPTPPGTEGDPQLDATIDWLLAALDRRPGPWPAPDSPESGPSS